MTIARIACVSFLLMLVLTGVVRIRLLETPLERDEGEYALAGQLLLQGIPPYQMAYNMKLPGTYVAYGAVFAVLGQTASSIHIGLLLVNIATAIALFFLARRLFDTAIGAVAGAAFLLLTVDQSVLGTVAHATHFVLLPALVGLLVLLSGIERRSRLLVFAAGILVGLAYIMKQHGIFFSIVALAWLLISLVRQRERPLVIISWGAWLGLAMVAPFALTCLALYLAGVFDSFWFWTFDYARAYASEVPLQAGVQILQGMLRFVTRFTWPMWILATIGLLAPIWDGQARSRFWLVATFAIGSWLAVCPGLYFRDHYFVLVMPAIAVLAAVGLNASARALSRLVVREPSPRREWLAAGLLVPALAVALLFPIYRERAYLTSTPDRVARALYGGNPFVEAPVLAQYIAADTDAADRILVLGSEPEIYFYAHRLPATGHIYMYGLMEEQPFAKAMQQEAIRQIEASQPRYVVFVNVPQSWLVRRDSDTTIFDWSRHSLTEHYRIVGIAEIRSSRETVYVWGEEAASHVPVSESSLQVFKRR
jgi:4-amino-4-deoxy-L-arabinose transferase-like glycosyltransferase